jgi:hypothetical protein
MLEEVVLGQDIMDMFHQSEVAVVLVLNMETLQVLAVQILVVVVVVENQDLVEDLV